jgi:DNA polymerase-4
MAASASGPPGPAILHVDMDAFFVSVELLRRPELRGQPVVVGGAGRRGVVAAASYEARAYGVYSAMPSARAQRLCPHAVFLAGDYAHYAEVSAGVMAILRSFTPLVEPLSLDEAFLDVSGACRLFGPAPDIAAQIRGRVLDEQGITCSVGVAPNKFLAKLGSEAAKPRADRRGTRAGAGVTVIEPGEELAFLHPLPVQAIWGVGPATLARLQRFGIRTVGDLAELPPATLIGAVGDAQGRHLHRLAHGIDDRSVEPHQKPKSVSHEETFPRDHHRRDVLRRELVRLSDAVAGRLRAAGLSGRTVVLKVRFGDFHTITRSITLAHPVSSGPAIARAAKDLFADIDPSPGVRLIGVGVSQLSEGGASRQLTFDDLDAADDAADWDHASAVVDEIRDRFGVEAVGPATLAGVDGLRLKRRGDQQWGPGQTEPPSPRSGA